MQTSSTVQTTRKFSTQELTKMALCMALLVVSGYINIPLPITPTAITAQTLVINLIAMLLLPRQALMTVTAYLLLGLTGVPVFAGFSGGVGSFAGASGGYLVGFLAACVLMSLAYHKGESLIKAHRVRGLICTILIGMPVIYLFGAPWMSYVMNMTLEATLLAAVVPYLAGDILKCVVAVVIAVPLQKAIART